MSKKPALAGQPRLKSREKHQEATMWSMNSFISKCTILVVAMLIAVQAFAAPGWYHGSIKRIYLTSNGFVVTLNSTALDDCQSKYAYYKVSILGDRQVDRALSIVLAAQASGRSVGIVIDKSINGPGGKCNSTGSMDIKD